MRPLAQPLLREFMDVCPSDLPMGLPPLRGTKHQIDVLHNADQALVQDP